MRRNKKKIRGTHLRHSNRTNNVHECMEVAERYKYGPLYFPVVL